MVLDPEISVHVKMLPSLTVPVHFHSLGDDHNLKRSDCRREFDRAASEICRALLHSQCIHSNPDREVSKTSRFCLVCLDGENVEVDSAMRGKIAGSLSCLPPRIEMCKCTCWLANVPRWKPASATHGECSLPSSYASSSAVTVLWFRLVELKWRLCGRLTPAVPRSESLIERSKVRSNYLTSIAIARRPIVSKCASFNEKQSATRETSRYDLLLLTTATSSSQVSNSASEKPSATLSSYTSTSYLRRDLTIILPSKSLNRCSRAR